MQIKRSFDRWRDFLPLGTVVICGCLLACTAFMSVRGYYDGQDRQQFRRSATYYATSFKDDVARHLSSLAAIHAFVTTAHVTRWEFSTYAHQILPQNPGLRAVLWVPNIAAAGRADYEKALQQDGLYGLHIRTLTKDGALADEDAKATYLPISYIEPSDGNINLVGLDLAPIARYAALFGDAARSGKVAASPVYGKSMVSGTQGPVVLLAYPLSTGSGAGMGYALGVMQLSAILNEAMGPTDQSIQAGFAYQDKGDREAMIWGPGARQPLSGWFGASRFSQSVPLDIGGRHFVLALRGTAQTNAMTAFYIPAGALLLVLALTTLLAQNMTTTLLRKRVVERAVVARTAELSTANASLVLEVEQRRQAEADLRVARDRAESASRAKSAFLATMSHELRTPLNAIIGFSDIMAGAPEPVPQQADYAGEILSNGRRLLDLINDILDLTQMETPETALDQDLFYLSDCIPVLIEKAEPAARATGVTLKTRVPDGLPPLHGDAKRIAKAIAHLISNAIKFTPQGGAAVVAVHHSAATLVVEVMDTGVGISAAARERIREDFWQQEGHLSRRHEGTGLGLAYVARVADLHGAGFSILSEPGKGTCVRLIFTCAEPQHVREVA